MCGYVKEERDLRMEKVRSKIWLLVQLDIYILGEQEPLYLIIYLQNIMVEILFFRLEDTDIERNIEGGELAN